jgi:hypothetical protein
LLQRTVFCCICTFIEAKAGLFLLHGSNFWDFSVKRFCFIHTIFLLQRTVFCCIGTFMEAKAGLREFGGTRVSMRRRRIAGTDPSEDAQSFPIGKVALAPEHQCSLRLNKLKTIFSRF